METKIGARGAKLVKGEPCPNGHEGWRYASSGVCVDCRRTSMKLRGEGGRGFVYPKLDAIEVNQERRRYAESPKKHWSPSGFIAPPTRERLMAGR